MYHEHGTWMKPLTWASKPNCSGEFLRGLEETFVDSWWGRIGALLPSGMVMGAVWEMRMVDWGREGNDEWAELSYSMRWGAPDTVGDLWWVGDIIYNYQWCWSWRFKDSYAGIPPTGCPGYMHVYMHYRYSLYQGFFFQGRAMRLIKMCAA